MHTITTEAFVRVEEKNPGEVRVLKWDVQAQKRALDSDFERVAETAEKISELVKKTNEPREVLPSFSVLNRLHAAISSLLEYHH